MERTCNGTGFLHAHAQDRKGGKRTRFAGAAICAACVAVAAQPAAAQGLNPTWVDFDTMPGVNGYDEVTDIVYSDVGPVTSVYVTGWMTTSSGATVMATTQFKANSDPGGQFVRRALYPDPLTATGTNKASSMTIDPATGDIYVAGEINGANGQDYAVIKYDADLNLHQSWQPTQFDPIVGVRTYDGTARNDDRIIDVEFLSHIELRNPILVVTGESKGQLPPYQESGISTGYDIVTIGYNAATGERDPYYFKGNNGVRRYDANYGDDRPAEMRLELYPLVFDPDGEGGSEYRPMVYIAATQWTDYVARNDILLLNYGARDKANTFAVQWVMKVYNGLTSGDDFGTGIDAHTFFSGGEAVEIKVVAIGVTPHFDPPAAASSGSARGGTGNALLTVPDNDYITLNFDALLIDGLSPDGFALPRWSSAGYGEGIRICNGPGTPLNSDDYAADIAVVPGGQPFTSIAWITGKAGDAAGTVYGAGTLRYDTSTYAIPDTPSIVSMISGAQSVEQGVGVTAMRQDQFYVTGSIAGGQVRDFLTFKIDDAFPNTPIWLATQDASGGIDRATAITRKTGSAVVFVAGYGYRPGTGRDFMVIRYDGP